MDGPLSILPQCRRSQQLVYFTNTSHDPNNSEHLLKSTATPQHMQSETACSSVFSTLLLRSASGTISEVSYHKCNLKAFTAIRTMLQSHTLVNIGRISNHYAGHRQQLYISVTEFTKSQI